MKKIILANAIIWALMILLAAWFFKDNENHTYMFGALLVGFTFMNGLLYNHERKEKARNCLK